MKVRITMKNQNTVKTKVRYSFLFYSLFLSVLLALASGIDGFGMSIIFVAVFTAVLMVTRYIYQILENVGVKIYEKHIKDYVGKIKATKKEIEKSDIIP
jgi:hypothetical protein